LGGGRDMGCLDERTLSSYLDERISDADRSDIEGHIAGCNRCLDLLVVAYEAHGRFKKCPAILKEKIKARFGIKQKKRGELKWLLACVFFFALSFVFRQYFLQFLAGAVILGFKWVMEGEGAKRIVMIFKGMKDNELESGRNRINQLKKHE